MSEAREDDIINTQNEVEDIRLGGADYVHFDVMDGRFVPNISIGIPVLKSLRRATEMFIDAHLMILEPIRYAEAFCRAGADLVNFHVESDSLENILSAINVTKSLGKKAGVTLKPGIAACFLKDFCDGLDTLLGGYRFFTDVAAEHRNRKTPAALT